MPEIKIQKTHYKGWDNCVQITNGFVDLVVTTDIGPRIIRYGFIGQENEMCEIEETLGLTGGGEWRIYGGHRLWHAPEAKPRTYEPDNNTVEWEEIPGGVKTIQDVEPVSRIKKEMEITLSPENSTVRILHRLTNAGLWPIELSVWGISAMAKGGKEIIPQAYKDTGLLPNRVLSLWPYTKLNDPRVYWGNKYIIIRQEPIIKNAFKIGISNESGWAAYFNHGHLFVKHYTHYKNARYPDFGASYETYVNDFMLEMETLSPLTLLEPDTNIEHIEEWSLFDNIQMPSDSEEYIERALTGVMRPLGL
ncbi:MAG: hypothetical protein HY756_04525 [Nitrospirae bacterium]|nr:hypothetical protein [Nitrospirota bacterium]